MSSAALVATALVSPVGIGTRATWAAVRGGISHILDSAFIGENGQPIRMAEVPDPCLPPLPEGIATGKTARYRRMLRLCIAALDQIDAPASRPVPLFLGLPEKDASGQYPALEPFLTEISRCFPGRLDLVSSRIYAEGRASGFKALEAALDMLSRAGDEQSMVLVGGVDSYRDPLLLAHLDRAQRLLGGRGDGFIPGEGAGLLLLRKGPAAGTIQLTAAANTAEPGHLLSDELCHGDGLTQAFAKTLAAADQPVRTVFCGLNGENASGKEWGLAAVRLGGRLDPAFRLFHPADCYGDLGAASAPALWCLGALGLAQGHLSGPLLSWCAADAAPRGSALLLAPA